MNHFWIGLTIGILGTWALVVLAIIAIRGAEHSGPIASGHLPMDGHDDCTPDHAEDDLDVEHRALINQHRRDAA